MHGKWHTEVLKIEAVRQVTGHGHAAAKVAARFAGCSLAPGAALAPPMADPIASSSESCQVSYPLALYMIPVKQAPRGRGRFVCDARASE